MRLLEDDYLGGHGSRGSGKISFMNLKVDWRSTAFYRSGSATEAKAEINGEFRTVADILKNFDSLKAAITFVEE